MIALRTQLRCIASACPPERRGGRDPRLLAIGMVYAANRRVMRVPRPVLTADILGEIMGIPGYSIRDGYNSLVQALPQDI